MSPLDPVYAALQAAEDDVENLSSVILPAIRTALDTASLGGNAGGTPVVEGLQLTADEKAGAQKLLDALTTEVNALEAPDPTTAAAGSVLGDVPDPPSAVSVAQLSPQMNTGSVTPTGQPVL
jgi:hypothetical protein